MTASCRRAPHWSQHTRPRVFTRSTLQPWEGTTYNSHPPGHEWAAPRKPGTKEHAPEHSCATYMCNSKQPQKPGWRAPSGRRPAAGKTLSRCQILNVENHFSCRIAPFLFIFLFFLAWLDFPAGLCSWMAGFPALLGCSSLRFGGGKSESRHCA